MNTRSCLLTVGLSALLATGSVLTAAPASAAPGSTECVSAQAALSAQIGVAAVDIALANQIRSSISTLDALIPQLEALYLRAEASISDEIAALDAAYAALDAVIAGQGRTNIAEQGRANIELQAAELAATQADTRLQIAIAAVEAVPPGDEGRAAAEEELTAAQTASAAADEAVVIATAGVATADAAFIAAEEAAFVAEANLNAAEDIAFSTPEFIALSSQYNDAAVEFEAALTALGATEGSDRQQLLDLADAAVAACSAPAVAHTPVVRAVPQPRGMNIQTAAHDAGATGPANLALMVGLAGFGAAAAAGSAVVVRRRVTDRA